MDKDTRICKNCGFTIEGQRKKLFCSSLCCGKYYQKQVGILGTGLPTATTGTIGELRVACDLLSKGYEVFRALSASCSCDLAILDGKQLLKIEVRTGYINRATGNRMLNRPKDETKYDIFAIVLPNEIVYEPELSEERSEIRERIAKLRIIKMLICEWQKHQVEWGSRPKPSVFYGVTRTSFQTGRQTAAIRNQGWPCASGG